LLLLPFWFEPVIIFIFWFIFIGPWLIPRAPYDEAAFLGLKMLSLVSDSLWADLFVVELGSFA